MGRQAAGRWAAEWRAVKRRERAPGGRAHVFIIIIIIIIII